MQIDIEKEILKAISHPLEADRCFLCATPLDNSNRSNEDVIPLWLQRDLELRDEELTLMNRSSIPYRKLKIPCCVGCNTKHLARIEGAICSAVREGFESALELPEYLIFQWLAKLYIGLLYRELTLPLDRMKPELGSITSRGDLSNARILWFWLRQEMTKLGSNTAPGSLWVFRCLIPPAGIEERFDLHTFHSPPTLGIRINQVGLVVDFLDCGLLRKQLKPIEADLQRLRLAPSQFVEAFVRISYKAHLFGLHTTARAAIGEDGEQFLVFTPRSTVPGDKIYAPWNEMEYASFLADRMGLAIEDIMLPSGRAQSWIYSENGKEISQYQYKDTGQQSPGGDSESGGPTPSSTPQK